MSNRVLLTVSGTIATDLKDSISSGGRPRADYVELARVMGADIIDHSEVRRTATRFGRAARRIAGDNVLLAWTCFRRRRRYDAIVTDGEQVGIPYAALTWLSRRASIPRHAMIVHIISVPKKALLFRALRLRRRIDTMFAYSSWQAEFARAKLGVSADAVVLTPFMVDTSFFDIAQVTPARRRMICAAGLELRDYDTLVDAVRGLDVEVVIAAASPWSKRNNSLDGSPLPDNITTCKLSLFELRQLYADSAFVVMPLHDVEFQAGVTTILEAMSMSRAVVCSRTRGQTDVIVDGETGVYVEPANAAALRAAISDMLDDTGRADELGAAARRWVVPNADIERYAAGIADVVNGLVRRRSA